MGLRCERAVFVGRSDGKRAIFLEIDLEKQAVHIVRDVALVDDNRRFFIEITRFETPLRDIFGLQVR